MLLHLVLYIAAFFFIWIGSGLIVSSIDSFSKRLRLSSFVVSFIVLGLLTSTPEFAIGLASVADHDASIYTGNLIGGIPVLFLLVIPLLAIIGNGVTIKHELEKKDIMAILGGILAPSIVILDKRVTNFEGVLLILLYTAVIYLIIKRYHVLSPTHQEMFKKNAYSLTDVMKLVLGIGIVFIMSTFIVDKTIFFAEYFHISIFVVSLIVLSVGTNLPELSLAVRSVMLGKKDVAFGDYLGSASVNTLLFGIFTLLYHGEVVTVDNFFITFYYIVLGLTLFYYFSRSNSILSRKEGFVLLFVYFVFVAIELSGIRS